MLRALVLPVALLAASQPAHAQPVDLPIPAARTTTFPAGIHLGKIGGRTLYLDGKGRVLYGMDMRVLLRAGPDPAQACTGDCAATWEPLLAPGATPNIAYPRSNRPAPPPPGITFYNQPQEAPDWTIIAGPQGPQWVYKGWHMVFTRRGADARSDRFDGTQDRAWNTLKYTPPAPGITAPAGVRAVAMDGSYVLADERGRLLYTGTCKGDCTGWEPFRGGMNAAGIGAWRIGQTGDFPQWQFHDQPVFVSPDDAPTDIPTGGKALRP